MERYTKSLAKQAVGEYAEVAKKHGLTPTELALAWCKSKWQVRATDIHKAAKLLPGALQFREHSILNT